MNEEIRKWDIRTETELVVNFRWLLLGDFILILQEGLRIKTRVWRDGIYLKLRTYIDVVHIQVPGKFPKQEIEFVPFLVYETKEYIVVRKEHVTFHEQLYVVHYSYFLDSQVFYLDGMTGVFAMEPNDDDDISEDDELLRISHVPTPFYFAFEERKLDFLTEMEFRSLRTLDMMQERQAFRISMYENVQSALKKGKGYGNIYVSMSNIGNSIWFYLTRGSLSGSCYSDALPGKVFRTNEETGIATCYRSRKSVHIHVKKVESLFHVLGKKWFYYPLTDPQPGPGSLKDSLFACIPHWNSRIILKYDFNMMELTMSVKNVIKVSQEIVESTSAKLEALLNDMIQKLEGQYIMDPSTNNYYKIIRVEQNLTDFHEIKGRESCAIVIAWCFCYNNPEFNNALLPIHITVEEELMKKHCVPLCPTDITQNFIMIASEGEYI